MRRPCSNLRQLGFTLIELLVALGIFLLITGAAFTLLGTSQKRYQTDSQVLTSFQEARLGLDQIVRDVNDSGYPPPTFNSGFPNQYASTPFAWSPGYPTLNPCTVGTSCASPTGWDIIVETNPNPQDPACAPNCLVQWIRYQLPPGGTTLMRGVVNKTAGDDPASDTSAAGVLVPFVQNVVNNVCPATIPTCQTAYPGIFSGGAVPVFTYICDTPTAPQSPAPLCSNAGADNSPANIRDVTVTLIVAAPLPDATTGQPRVVMLNGRGRRINPNQ
jgi:prepilin-type N-terminal cleavage/methylation domain-containing protein